MSKEVLILTGMTGAGRSTVAHALEDLGWYVVDNLPPTLLSDLINQGVQSEISALAVVVDVRGGKFFDELASSLAHLKKSGTNFRVAFLDATDQALVQRFESTRRPHPLQGSGRIVDGIAAEREKLQELLAQADVVIDTSNLNVHQLEKRTAEIFAQGLTQSVRVNVLSFGYKYGIPVDADLVLDCRFIPNPHWIPELRPLSGLDEKVKSTVLANPGVGDFVNTYVSLIQQMLPGYLREGKKYLTVAIGCTGGKHRSVSVAREIADKLDGEGAGLTISAHASHRDVGRE
ncbi:RNase adapter protein RapZ [Candidatus Planktophila limnetica]|uniref:RNase adapter protein RapZ n=1 Tax=Candidatus Planktophila limnetica TaxID=573600 RepID=A0A249LF84_9ACTN|nr:RNase adapter RapZ [Candidatus Planktophila limnetica]ASY27781.1 RNase adapter protein RapZ [Candidatus Planktophila limnetica]